MPLGDLAGRFGELDRARDIVVYCHHGVRSVDAAVDSSAAAGFRARNLEGGIPRGSTRSTPPCCGY